MSVRTTAKRCGAKVGVKLSTHVLRHPHATHLIKGGVDVRHVQKLLGHKDISTTTLYTKVHTTNLRGHASPLPPQGAVKWSLPWRRLRKS